MLLNRHFRKYYIKYAVLLLLGVASLVFVSYIQLRIPEALGKIVDYLSEYPYGSAMDYETSMQEIWPLLVEIGSIVIIIFFGRFLWRFFLMGTSRRVEEDLRNEMFLHCTKLPQSYFSGEKTGALMTLFTNDLEAVRNMYGWGLLMLIDGLVLGTLVLVRMFTISWELTLMAFGPLLLAVIIAFSFVIKMQKKFKERQESVERLSDFSQENFSGISVIKAYVKEQDQKNEFKEKATDLFKKDIGFIKYSISINIVLSFAITLIVGVVLLFGSWQILQNQLIPDSNTMTEGTLTTYVLFFFTLIWPVMALANFFFFRAQGSASGKRIAELLDAQITIKDENVDKTIVDFTGEITFKNLSFCYPDGDVNVIDDLSFKINAGQSVGILGKTGSGKSSLVELLLRVYDVEPGMIYFDNHDVHEIKIANLRDAIGYVPQDNFLFSDTISNNIGFSFKTPDITEVQQAAKMADVYDNVIEFADGFDTILGERGVTVSGGQKQRISIARALAKDPKILILDDSVSAVDTKTEASIIANLKRVRKNRTTIFIAHRISTVKDLDVIVLLDKGKLVAIGSHHELLASCEIYAEMVRKQALEKYVEEGEDERF